MQEFAGAMRSGRLIAFVGSFATKDAGYSSWDDFLRKYAKLAHEIVLRPFANAETSRDQQELKRAQDAMRAIRASMPKGGAADSEKKWDNALTSLSVIKQIVLHFGETHSKELEEFDEKIGEIFHLKPPKKRRSNAELIAALEIDRVITLNYDLEFEWLWMTTAGEKADAGGERHKCFAALRDGGVITAIDQHSQMRMLPDGKSVISDVFSRERTDRLVEFAVGSPDYEAHILHLHGVAVSPETMVISQWDYNQQYRRSGISKLPFEHGLRVLFAGNPILFIGVGMSERDVTATLEQIVSDHPHRRIAPAFILWNAPGKADWDPARRRYEKEAFRFRWLHRFGVLTIFDDEIAPKPLGGTDQQRLKRSIENLGRKAADLVKPYPWRSADFRNIGVKLKSKANIASGHYDIWPPPTEMMPKRQAAIPAKARSDKQILLFVGRPGLGKGAIAKRLRDEWHRRAGAAGKAARSMIINASFVFELESVFSLLSGLGDDEVAADQQISRGVSLTNYMEDQAGLIAGELLGIPPKPGKGGEPPRLLIVINGMERFFSPSGQPLSTELDGLLRSVIRLHNEKAAIMDVDLGTGPQRRASDPPPFLQIAILGTSRVRKYFAEIEVKLRNRLIENVELDDPKARNRRGSAAPSGRAPVKEPLRSAYFRRLEQRFATFEPEPVPAFIIERKNSSDAGELRRHFLGAYLQTGSLEKAGFKEPDLCFDILMVMAHVGQPLENAVLFHAPRIQKRLNRYGTRRERAKALDTAVRQLCKRELILPRAIFEDTPKGWQRLGLHRSVLTELRDRVGVPLSDSKLSSGFNISLFAAQPVEGYSPEAEIHEELDMLVDWLIGAYKDESLDQSRSGRRARTMSRGTDDPNPARAKPHAEACLRAALAVVRNYYSTAALLTLDVTDQDEKSQRDGPLAQHAERLDRLLAAAVDNAEARRGSGGKRKLGPAPFYPDDLVWLLNERGVVKLTQGDLYEARYSFDEALRLNQEFVEFGDRGNNWRRLMINQLHVDIERARLDSAERRIGEIEHSLGQGLKSFPTICAYVVKQYGKRVSSQVHVVDGRYEHDVILTIGLLYGYRGLCLHLGGELKLASEMFQVSVNILENIGEQRAYAMFQRFYGSLKAALGQTPEALEAFKLAIASSEATRQTDIANHARIAEAWHGQRSQKSESASRAKLIRSLQRSLRYAEAGEMHRVRVEAGLNLARIKFEGGDYDSALERVADAMATATRYGMSLRKISLRILMGQILMRRGDHESGPKLIDRASRNADRVGYQGAVGLAQRVRALEEDPAASPRP
jgi:tetratricopeptide (TPR) repeat protein